MPRIRLDKYRLRAVKAYLDKNMDVDKVVQLNDALVKEDYGLTVDSATGQTYLDDCYQGRIPIQTDTFIAVTFDKECFALLTLKDERGHIKELIRV